MEKFEVLHVKLQERVMYVHIKFKEKTIKTTFRIVYPAKQWKMTDILLVKTMKSTDRLHHIISVMEMEKEGTWDSFQQQIFSLEKEILQDKKIRIKRLFINQKLSN
jgi:hypothetical protein